MAVKISSSKMMFSVKVPISNFKIMEKMVGDGYGSISAIANRAIEEYLSRNGYSPEVSVDGRFLPVEDGKDGRDK